MDRVILPASHPAARYARVVIEEAARRWNPSRGWIEALAPTLEVLERAPTMQAWCDLAMTFGDTRAPVLALIVCLHAEATAAPGADLGRVRSHRNLCLLDLGIAHGPAQVRLVDLAGVVEHAPPALDTWLSEALAPFDGSLPRAAQYVLALAAARLGR